MDIDQFRATYRVKIVKDSWNNELTINEAVQKGIVDIARSHYVNKVTGNRMSIAEAIQRGLIVQFTPMERIAELRRMGEANKGRRMSSFARVRTTDDVSGDTPSRNRLERSKSLRDSRNNSEKQNSVVSCFYGLITFKNTVKTLDYSIISAIDTTNGTQVPFDQAKLQGLLDVDSQTYVCSQSQTTMSFSEAIEKGLLDIKKLEPSHTDVVEEHYVVYGVMDLLEQRRLTFKEAVENFVLVHVPPVYRDTLNHEDLPLEVAIRNQFVMAKLVEGNSHSLYDRMIHTDNRIEAERESTVLIFRQH